MELFENIAKLCALDGISGREQEVSAEIMRQASSTADEVKLDNLGNVIAFKKGKKTPAHKIALAAHMDEVGFIVTGITEEGCLRFAAVGGVDPKVVLGRRVRVGDKKVWGVIGTKALHQLTEEERKTVPELKKLLIDIGAKDKADAEQFVRLGDSVTFSGDFREYGDGFVCAKALDDRAGCAILLDLLQRDLDYDTYFIFTVQEEIGTRGARAAGYSVDPDIALIVETTASGDVAGVKGEKRVSVIGGGAVVTYMDNGAIYDKALYDLAFQTAGEKGIPCQTKTAISGGNDAGAFQVSHGGTRTCALSVPCRYLHSPADAAKREDIAAVRDLAAALLPALGEL